MSQNDDLISRHAAIKAIGFMESKNKSDGFSDEFDIISRTKAMIEISNLPSVQPETAKFIRWMECKKTAEYISYTPHCKCSKCGTEFLITTIKYCYMCGAKMEENNEAD